MIFKPKVRMLNLTFGFFCVKLAACDLFNIHGLKIQSSKTVNYKYTGARLH